MVNEKITLNASKNNVDIVLKAIQGENDARAFEVTVTDINGVPVPLGGATANMYIEKRDGNIVMLPGTVSGNSATFVLTLQASSVPGDNKVWVQIVEPDVMDLRADGAVLRVTPCDLDGAVESSSEFTALTELVASAASSAQSAAGSASAAAQSAAQAAESVQSLTVNGKQGPSITLTAADVGAPTEGEFSALESQTEEHIGDSLIHFQMSSVFDAVYPVGSIYMSTNAANPSDLFGGEWEKYAQGRVIVGVGNNGETEYTLGITGGKDIIKNTHNHYTTMSYDGAGLYSNQNSSALRSRTKNSSNRAVTYPDEKGSGLTREDSTYDETLTLDVRQPYISCYIWRRIA